MRSGTRSQDTFLRPRRSTYATFDTYLRVINTKYYSALIVFLGVWTVYRIGVSAADYFPADNHEPNRAIPVLKFALRVAIWGLGLMMILNTLEINITPFLAGAGIAGVAVTLADQDVLGNFFGGVVLYVDTPFQADDWVQVSGQFGEVL